jgi:hypothetical protein
MANPNIAVVQLAWKMLESGVFMAQSRVGRILKFIISFGKK